MLHVLVKFSPSYFYNYFFSSLALILYLLVAEETLVSQTVGSSSPQHDSNPTLSKIQPSSPQVETSASPRMHPTSPQPEASALPRTPPAFPQLEASALPRTPQVSPQLDIQESLLEPKKLPSPTQEAKIDVSMNTHLSIFLSNKSPLIRQENPFQEETVSSPIYSFAVDDLIVEKGDEAYSSQALSEENQAQLKEILSLLQRNVEDQVKDADLLREALALIDHDLPADIKAYLEPVSKLDDHFVAVKQALKNLSSQPALEQQQVANKQSMKDLHIQMQNHKELLTKLQPELELKKARKAELEVELRTLTIEIEADEKKMPELPESMEKIQKEATTTMTAGKQLKTKLSTLSKTQEVDQRLLENINKMISDAFNVISKYLGV
jgi:hypothetical protein